MKVQNVVKFSPLSSLEAQENLKGELLPGSTERTVMSGRLVYIVGVLRPGTDKRFKHPISEMKYHP